MGEEPEKENGGHEHEEGENEFRELLKFTAGGYGVGLALGFILDGFGFQRSGAGQWLVRTMAGEGESLFEGIYALRRRLRRARSSMSEAYGWGKLLGMMFPWLVDLASRLLGVNVYGVEGFFIPYFYAMSDQIGANISGSVFLIRREKDLRAAAREYFRNPVMISSLAVIFLVPAGLLLARVLGFSPSTQVLTALEVMAANLCWIPPLVGWFLTRKERRCRECGEPMEDNKE